MAFTEKNPVIFLVSKINANISYIITLVKLRFYKTIVDLEITNKFHTFVFTLVNKKENMSYF